MSYAGAVGARHGGQGRVRRGTAAAAKDDPTRKARVAKMLERDFLDDLFRRHDEHHQGSLEFLQFAALLQELNDGQALSEAEIKFVLHLADADQNTLITRGELSGAVGALRGLQADQKIVAARFEFYDSARTGFLMPNQVERLLQDINKGNPVSSEELAWIMRHADADGNHKIDLEELRSAIALWYLHTTRQAEQKQKAEASWHLCCCGQRPTMEKYEYPGALSDADETNQP
jgi:Ca2+-binding EF-hand superfamily protein